MCPAAPYALAAKFAYPDRPVIGCMGDGAFQMLGMNTLIDFVKYPCTIDGSRFRQATGFRPRRTLEDIFASVRHE